jgi:hypothetical protein
MTVEYRTLGGGGASHMRGRRSLRLRARSCFCDLCRKKNAILKASLPEFYLILAGQSLLKGGAGRLYMTNSTEKILQIMEQLSLGLSVSIFIEFIQDRKGH